MKQVIKYFGSKSSMLKQINSFMPPIESYDIYVEPFGGGASVLLSQDRPGKVEVYNDLYNNVYSLHKVMSDKELFWQFKEKCDIALYCEKLREQAKEQLKNPDLSILDRAFYYFYFNRTSHNGHGGFSTNACIRRGMSKSTSDFLSVIDRLPQLHDRLSSVLILNKDAFEVMDKYNQENVFFYLDPPYSWETRTSSRYKVDFNPEQQKALVDKLLTVKSKILLSGYINDEYKRLEMDGFKRIDFEVKTITPDFKPKTKLESCWLNY